MQLTFIYNSLVAGKFSAQHPDEESRLKKIYNNEENMCLQDLINFICQLLLDEDVPLLSQRVYLNSSLMIPGIVWKVPILSEG